jgi:Putative peptidoglycan binding domain
VKTLISVVCLCAAFGIGAAHAQDLEELWFRPTETLAPRDEYGLLHSSKTIDPPDFAPRYRWRPLYYLEGGNDLIHQPAYVGALQTALKRLGYYCGPIDGVYTDDVSTAVAHMQKNYSMRVTGTITIPVRRALHLP